MTGVVTGEITWRRLWSLMTSLPADSAVARAVQPRAAWSTEAYLLAAAVDLLAAGNWQRGGKKNVPRPKPLPRPGDKKRIGTARTVADFEAVYARARQRVDDGEVTWASTPPG